MNDAHKQIPFRWLYWINAGCHNYSQNSDHIFVQFSSNLPCLVTPIIEKNIYISAINKYFTEIFKNAFRKTSNILINSKKNKKSLHNFKMFWKKSCIQMNDGVVWFRLQKQTEPIAMGCVSSGSAALKNSVIRNSENEQQKQIGITL